MGEFRPTNSASFLRGNNWRMDGRCLTTTSKKNRPSIWCCGCAVANNDCHSHYKSPGSISTSEGATQMAAPFHSCCKSPLWLLFGLLLYSSSTDRPFTEVYTYLQ